MPDILNVQSEGSQISPRDTVVFLDHLLCF